LITLSNAISKLPEDGAEAPQHVRASVTQFNTMPVQKVSGHLEYLENRSRGLDVTWQPVRGDLTVHP